MQSRAMSGGGVVVAFFAYLLGDAFDCYYQRFVQDL